MSEETREIFTEEENFIDWNCTPKGVQMMVHSSKGNAVAIGGSAIPLIIRNYITEIVDQTRVPRAIVVGLLMKQIRDELQDIGINVTIELPDNIKDEFKKLADDLDEEFLRGGEDDD